MAHTPDLTITRLSEGGSNRKVLQKKNHTPSIVKGTMAHVDYLAKNMRVSDVNEVWASSMSTPMESLTRAFSLSSDGDIWTGLIGEEVVCMAGVVSIPNLNRCGSPWLLGTDLVDKHGLRFLRNSPKFLNTLHAKYDHLVNFVDARNTTAIKWLRWLGFTIHSAQSHGKLGLPFHRVTMIYRLPFLIGR
jgi:hypothetical protein